VSEYKEAFSLFVSEPTSQLEDLNTNQRSIAKQDKDGDGE
jgi:hypothetical protein